jgi:anaerobic magnesium-protoporphyrin IX monomethyl ester cyclase
MSVKGRSLERELIMKMTLMHPPLDDPTMPYHSMAYLAGHLAHNGFTDVSMRDINIEFVNYCLEKKSILAFYEESERRIRQLEGRTQLSFRQQEEYYALWIQKRFDDGALKLAVEGLRNKEAFLDFPLYLNNVDVMLRYFGFIGALSYPSEIAHFRQMSRARYSVYNLNDLLSQELMEKMCYPFTRFLEERLASDEGFLNTDCFGISIVYDHQLSYALYMARFLKQKWPDKLIILGGTSISQLYKYLKDKSQMKRFFSMCDAIIVGEGETALCEIAAAGGDFSKKTSFPNTITYDAKRDQVRFPAQIHYEDVNSLGSPLFSYPWDLYLSPEPGVSIAPTRGCYWNRCTFCDYGLNTDSPTSPWRERKIERVIDDIQKAQEREKIKYIYFAVDVMAPGYMERLCDAIVEARLDIRWSAELRMEKIFSAERCRKMVKSGCVCISFGMESGNQRVLDLIDKGTKVDYMAKTMKNFASAGVAVQLMAFTDFPTETQAEKKETFNFVEMNKEYWSTGGMGTFLLTGTALIAKNPEKFGIKLLETRDVDVARAISYRVDADTDRELLLTEDSDVSFDEGGGVFPKVLGRPWAGGTDSLHTMIYYDAYGREFFKEHPLDELRSIEHQGQEDVLQCTLFIPGKVNESPFDISGIIANRENFLQNVRELLKVPIEPTHSSFSRWQAGIELLPRSTGGTNYWITESNKCARIEKLVYRILLLAAEQELTLGDVLGNFKGEMAEKLLEYFKGLEASKLLVFKDPYPAAIPDAPVNAGAIGQASNLSATEGTVQASTAIS